MTNLPEHGIIKILIDNISIYNKYNKYIDINYIKEYNKDLFFIFEQLRLFRKEYPENDSSTDFHVFVTRAIGPDTKRRAVFEQVWKQVVSAEATSEHLVQYLSASKRKALFQKIAVAAFEASENDKAIETFQGLVKTLEAEPLLTEAPDQNEIEFVTDDLEELYAGTVATPGFLSNRCESVFVARAVKRDPAQRLPQGEVQSWGRHRKGRGLRKFCVLGLVWGRQSRASARASEGDSWSRGATARKHPRTSSQAVHEVSRAGNAKLSAGIGTIG